MSNEASHDGTQERESPVSRGTLLTFYLGFWIWLDVSTTAMLVPQLGSETRVWIMVKATILFVSLAAIVSYSLRMEEEE